MFNIVKDDYKKPPYSNLYHQLTKMLAKGRKLIVAQLWVLIFEDCVVLKERHKMNFAVHTKYLFIQNTLKDDPRTFLKGILAVFFVNIMIYYMFNPTYALIALILTILSLTEIFFTFKYALYDDKLVVDRVFYKIKHEYTYYKKVSLDKNGVFLSPYRISSRMETFRGVLLRIPKDKRKEVLEFLKSKIETNINITNINEEKKDQINN